MNNKDERYLNITLQNEQEEKDEIVFSFSAFFHKLKKYLLPWIVTTVVASALVFTGSFIFTADSNKELTALVSFTYDGIEKGLDPAGNSFDINSIKTPYVIEAALSELNLPLDNLENIRQGFSFIPVYPSDAIDRITVYKSVYEDAASGNLNAAQAMLDVKLYPTQYKVVFNYANSDFDASEAANFMNIMLEKYRDYFFETYGYNRALGSAVVALDYKEYDYGEAIDVFRSTLTTLNSYVSNLADDDTTRFRSKQTGYTFADLSEAIKTLSNVDLDVISSYIHVNNVTKDKEASIDYYQYRIEALEREKTIAQENLNTISSLIESYTKDDIYIFGNGTDDTNTHSTIASEEYDKLIQQKIKAQNTLSTDKQQIEYYKKRITDLNSKTTASKEKIEKAEADLASLNEKVNNLIEQVNTTADEFYSTVSFANAYNILVPATGSVTDELINSVKGSLKIAAILAGLIFIVYVAVSFVNSMIEENKKKKAAVLTAGANEGNNNNNKQDKDEK